MLLDGNVDEHGRSQLFLSYIYSHRITPLTVFWLHVKCGDSDGDDCDTPDGDSSMIHLIERYEKEIREEAMDRPGAKSGDAGVFEKKNEKRAPLTHEKIMRQFSRSTGTIRETACQYSWFFFELTVVFSCEIKDLLGFMGAFKYIFFDFLGKQTRAVLYVI